MSRSSFQPMSGPYFARSSAPFDATWELRETLASAAVSWVGMAKNKSAGGARGAGRGGRRFIGLRKPALQNGHGHAQENRVEQQAHRPDAEADERLVERRQILDHRAERRGNE